MGWLDGRVALVTGGGSGIGRAVVERFLAEGARVGVLERVAARVEQLQAACGSAVIAVQGDVTCLTDNQHAVDATVRAFGQLDIFVGNAGVFDRFISLADLPGEQISAAFDELFGVNVKGAILVVLGRNNPSLYTVNGRPLYVHLNGLAIVLLK